MQFNAFGSAPKGFQNVTGLNVAKTLTPPVGAAFAVINAETQGVRWRDDGVAPTTTVGMLLNKDVEFVYQGNLAAIQFIEITASATLNVSYYAATGGLLKP